MKGQKAQMQHGKPLILAIGLALCAAMAQGQDLPAGAEIIAQEVQSPGVGLVATGPWSRETGLPALNVEGQVSQTSFQMPSGGLNTLQLLDQMRAGLTVEGFKPLYTCETAACGGFDFRFAIPVMTEPDMHVDLGDFLYHSAEKPGPDGPEYRAILISRAPGLLYGQITAIEPADPTTAAVAVPDLPATAQDTLPLPELVIAPEVPSEDDLRPALTTGGAIITELVAQGSLALDDLIFATGAADLLAGDYDSLNQLGTWLLSNPTVTLAFVGHTDATGGLAGNIALSKRRAESVRRWLLDKFDLPSAQVVAEGVGYLSPRAPNDTEAGRAKNRRVEAVVTSTR